MTKAELALMVLHVHLVYPSAEGRPFQVVITRPGIW